MYGLNSKLMQLWFASILFVGIVIVLLASTALAQDDEAPRVVAPEDIPGADVVMLEGDSYLLDLSESTDNIGIVLYRLDPSPSVPVKYPY